MVQYFKKLISLFDKNHLNKPTVSSEIIDTVLLMARPTIMPAAKQTTPKQKQS